MDKNVIIEHVNEVMVEGFELNTDQLHPDAKIVDDLELDSLDAIDMLVYLEEKINIKVDPEKFRTVKTLGDVYNVVEEVVIEAGKTR